MTDITLSQNYKRILVVKNRALGDAIMGLGTLQYLKEVFPDSEITYAVPKWIAPLFSGCKIAADKILSFELTTPQGWNHLWRSCQKGKFDIIYELHQKGRTEKFLKAYSIVSRTPYYFHNHNLEDRRAPAIQRDLETIAYSLKNSIEANTYLNYGPKIEPEKSSGHFDIILGVVATRKTKIWPLKHFASLTRLLKAEYPDCRIGIPISSSLFDQEIKTKLQEFAIEEHISFIQVDLDKLPFSLAGAKLYIGNDTGIKHLCIALGMKSLTLFGPEEPYEWHPYNTQRHPYFFKNNLYCRVEKAHFCSLNECSSMACLESFSPQKVMDTIKKENLY